MTRIFKISENLVTDHVHVQSLNACLTQQTMIKIVSSCLNILLQTNVSQVIEYQFYREAITDVKY